LRADSHRIPVIVKLLIRIADGQLLLTSNV